MKKKKKKLRGQRNVGKFKLRDVCGIQIFSEHEVLQILYKTCDEHECRPSGLSKLMQIKKFDEININHTLKLLNSN